MCCLIFKRNTSTVRQLCAFSVLLMSQISPRSDAAQAVLSPRAAPHTQVRMGSIPAITTLQMNLVLEFSHLTAYPTGAVCTVINTFLGPNHRTLAGDLTQKTQLQPPTFGVGSFSANPPGRRLRSIERLRNPAAEQSPAASLQEAGRAPSTSQRANCSSTCSQTCPEPTTTSSRFAQPPSLQLLSRYLGGALALSAAEERGFSREKAILEVFIQAAVPAAHAAADGHRRQPRSAHIPHCPALICSSCRSSSAAISPEFG